MPNASRWTIADIIDFEYLISNRTFAAVGEESERAGLLSLPGLGSPPERRVLFRNWVQHHRDKSLEALPGQHFAAGWHMLLTLGLIGGFLLGVGVAGGNLTYRTHEPINLAKFLLWTVGVQWLLLLMTGALWLFRRSIPDLRDFYPLHALLWSVELAFRRMPGEQRDRLRAVLGRLRHHREIYGSLLVWPMLIVTQLFAVAFNVAVLATTLLLVQVQDLRFGWQTTPNVSATEAHRRAALFALPWGWAPAAYPSVDQVTKSRYAPGQHLGELDVDATRAWWPFVAYAIVFYGLLVRSALLLHAAARLRKSLAGAKFNHAEANALYRKLTGPLIRADDPPEPLHVPAAQEASAKRFGSGTALALIATDAEVDSERLAVQLRDQLGWALGGKHPLEIDRPRANESAVEAIRNADEELAGVVVVVRARRSPIRAIALVLEELRNTLGAGRELVLLLVGRRTPVGYAPVSQEEFTHWQNFNAINGLHLGLEKWQP